MDNNITDIDVINELREAVKLYRTKKPVTVAGIIDESLSKDFSISEDKKYSNAISKMREHIGNITNQCSLKFTKRVIIVEAVLNELDGG